MAWTAGDGETAPVRHDTTGRFCVEILNPPTAPVNCLQADTLPGIGLFVLAVQRSIIGGRLVSLCDVAEGRIQRCHAAPPVAGAVWPGYETQREEPGPYAEFSFKDCAVSAAASASHRVVRHRGP